MNKAIYELQLKLVPQIREREKLMVVSSMTVIAESIEEARELASQQAGPEGGKAWMDPTKTSCKKFPLDCRVVERITINHLV